MAVKIRDRIVSVEKIVGRKLKPHPSNWKEHGRGQRDALRGVLEEIGGAGVLLGRKLKGGVVEILDGHMRADEEPDFEWTVAITDLDDEEAEKLLATYDPLSAMADAKSKLLDELMSRVQTDNADVRRLLADVRPSARELEAEGEGDEKPTELETNMALQPHEHYDYIVVLARTTQEWNVLTDRLGMKPEARRGSMGTAHAITAQRLLDVIGERDAKRIRKK